MALRDRLRMICCIKESPHRVSLAFATGVFIGMSPFLGIHTVLGILVAWLFSTWIGMKLLGIGMIIPEVDWKHMTFTGILNEFSPILKPFFLGTLLIGTLSAILSYVVIYRITKRRSG